MEMLLLGEEISAEKATEIGLINKVVAADELDRDVKDMAETIASKSMHVVKIGKEAFYQQAEMNLKDAYAYCADVMVQNMLARDAEEGIGAVLDKRSPNWQDR